jgi:hypothetical protein
MNPRDLLLHRYWRREDDGSYGMSCICYSLFEKAKRHNLQLGFGFSMQMFCWIHGDFTLVFCNFFTMLLAFSLAVILYHSVTHEKCPTRSGFRRAWLKSENFFKCAS